MADKMAAVQGMVTAFVGLTKESLDGASDSLDGDSEIKRRLIGRRNMMTHSAPLFKSMRILRIHDINTVQGACFVYRVIHNTLPALFHNFFVTNKFISDNFTRHNEDIYIYIYIFLRCNTNVRAFF